MTYGLEVKFDQPRYLADPNCQKKFAELFEIINELKTQLGNYDDSCEPTTKSTEYQKALEDFGLCD